MAQYTPSRTVRTLRSTSGDLTVDGGDTTIVAGEGVAATLKLQADEADDNGDSWLFTAGTDGSLTVGNDSTGSFDQNLVITSAGQLRIVRDAAARSAGPLLYGLNQPLIIEDDNRPGIQLIGSENNIGIIEFADDNHANAGSINFDHSTDRLRFGFGDDAEKVYIDADGNVYSEGGVKTQSKLLEVAHATSGTPSGDAGIIIERGSSDNAALLWDESRDEFVLCTTSATGASTGNLTFTPANLSVERLGAGTEQAQALLHVQNDVAASPAHSTNAQAIFEDNDRPAIQLCGSANNIGLIQFGDNAAMASGQIYYDHSTDKLRIDAGGSSDVFQLSASGVGGTAVKDEDDMSSDSATHLATQQSIKAYVDAQITAEDLDVTTDSGTIAIDLDSETLTIGGTTNEIETSATGNAVTIGLPDDVAVTGDLTVNGTCNIGSTIAVAGVKDEDTMSSDSNTHLATQQSIKAYVDAKVTAEDLDIACDGGTGSIDLDSETLTISGGAGVTTAISGNTVAIATNTAMTHVTSVGTLTALTVSDKVVELASGTSGTPSGDAGIIIERGTSDNAALIWDESRDEFVFGTTSATGASSGDLTVTRGNLSVAKIGAGTEQAEAQVHARNDTASTTLSSNAVVIIEDDNRPAIQLAGSANNIALIQFGDDAAAASGQIYYDHSTDKLRIDAGGNTDRLTVDSSGAVTTAGNISCGGNVAATGNVTAAGILSIADGSASAPSLTNTGDTNCGLYFSAADTLAFTAGGTAQVTFADGAVSPVADSDVDLGTSSLYWKNAYIDAVTTTGNIACGGNVALTGNSTVNGTSSVTGNTTLTGGVVLGTATINSDAQAISTTTPVTFLDSSSANCRCTLADGSTVGQHIRVISVNYSNTMDIDANFHQGAYGAKSTFTFSNAGALDGTGYLDLVWTGSKWFSVMYMGGAFS